MLTLVFSACCRGKGVHDDCLWLCSYALDFHGKLKNNQTALQACSPHITEMLTCASGNINCLFSSMKINLKYHC